MRRLRVMVSAAIAGAVLFACTPPRPADEAAITATLMCMFDKPEAPLAVGPVAVAGDAALADWTQGEMGGRALLRWHDSQWQIVLCAGDGIRSASALQAAGLSAAQAHDIVAELTGKEESVTVARLAAMSRFQTVVRMNAAESTGASTGHEHSSHGNIQVTDAAIPVPPSGAATAAGYVTIENTGEQDIRLVSAESPAAGAVTLHESSVVDGMVRMRPLTDGLLIRAGQRAAFEPGRDHLMLEGLTRPLAAGDPVPVTLNFTPIGKVEVTFAVKSFAQAGHGDTHMH